MLDRDGGPASARALMEGEQTGLSRRQLLALMGQGVAAGTLLSACGGGTSSSGVSTGADTRKPAKGGVLRFAHIAVPTAENLEPAKSGTFQTHQYLIYDRLVDVAHDDSLRPALARRWSANVDMTEWTFELRDDVTWHDGKPFSAQDVAYTVERLLDEQVASNWAVVATGLDPEKGVTVIDDHTIRFRVDQPAWDLPEWMSSNVASIIPAHVPVKQLNERPIGTGSFQFKDYVPGKRFVASRYGRAWRPPNLDEVQLIFVEDPAARVNGLRAGDYDVASDLSAIDVRTLEGDTKAKVDSVPSARYIAIAMNSSEPPFDDVRVRRAFKMLQDRQKVLDRVLLGKGLPGTDQPIYPRSPLFGDPKPLGRDVAGARRLLAEAGHENGLNVELLVTETFPGATRLASVFKEDAAEGGVEIKVTKLESSAFYDKVAHYPAPVNVPLYTEFWNHRPGDFVMRVQYGSKSPWNFHGWKSREFDRALREARAEIDEEARRQKYGRAEQIAADDGPEVVPVYHAVNAAVAENVVGWKTHPMSFPVFFWDLGFAES
jgi:peptide/nickel transport system substrate-binding protein